MQRIRILSLVTALAFAGAAVTASAGQRDVIPVEINGTSVQGVLADARGSADNRQYIGCYTTEYFGLCHAVDAAGQARGCTTRDPEQLAVMRSISSDSIVGFHSNKEGTCDSVRVGSYSVYRSAVMSGY